MPPASRSLCHYGFSTDLGRTWRAARCALTLQCVSTGAQPAWQRRRLRAAAEELAADQDGVLSRRQLRELGLTRFDVRSQVRAHRWAQPSRTTVAVRTGGLGQRQAWWVALLETGCSRAALDGVTALQAVGLTGFTAPITISCPRGAAPGKVTGADIRVTRWRSPGDVVGAGIPRVRPAVGAVRGALWAATDRQAALILVLAVQQRLTTPVRLRQKLARVGRHPRRRLLARLIADIDDGAQALGELDFASLCRSSGLPTPSRQVVRAGRRGRVYLDVYFDGYALVVEIDGIAHAVGLNEVDDALRQNELSLDGETVLRLPLLGLRLQPQAFLAQVERGLRRRGWPGPGGPKSVPVRAGAD